jgi:hypothetical protein
MIDYLIKLAPVGETVLFVKQKLTQGVHADGSMKSVWPAFLPEKYDGKGAWYCNTAMFIVDRLSDKVSAAAANCERVGFIVLDDVGTKSALPPLEPTWKIETSPNNYQWGYTFALDDQPTKGEYTAAYDAIAAAGYTDPGARNPVRNFRLPGSVNLKPERNNFAAVLTDFHPEREFSLPQICAALGVTPAPADTATHATIKITDDGTDDVFAWLSANNMVLSKPNPEGWAGIICPNNEQHTDGNPEGRYMPSTRSFCCLHSHCIDFDSKSFLTWVEDQGGPKESTGLRDELLAEMMQNTLSKLTPTEMFKDDAAAIKAEVEQRQLGRIEKDAWYDRFAYIQDNESFFDTQDRREISRSTFNALFRHIKCISIHTGRKVEASVCFDENRQAKGALALVGVTYAAGDSVIVSRDGDLYGNRWRDARPAYAAGDVTPWLDHCALLVPDKREREHLYDIMAFKVQYPKIKINHAVLHGGDQGRGKDTMWAPMIWAVCGDSLRNRGLLDGDTMNSQFGYALESEILILNELREPDARERRALANKLKPVIAAPPEMLSINRKGLHPYDMCNRMFVLAFSNDPVPISLDSQDRRWFAVWSHGPRMSPDVAQALWAWYRSGGFAAVGHWLSLRDVSAFNPSAAPFMTEFKLNLIEQGMSTAESYLVELIRARMGEFTKGVIASPFHALCDRLSGAAPAGAKVPQVALLHALKEAGWVDLGRVASSDYPSKKHVYCAPDMITMSRSDLRRMVEDNAPPLRMVK